MVYNTRARNIVGRVSGRVLYVLLLYKSDDAEVGKTEASTEERKIEAGAPDDRDRACPPPFTGGRGGDRDRPGITRVAARTRTT